MHVIHAILNQKYPTNPIHLARRSKTAWMDMSRSSLKAKPINSTSLKKKITSLFIKFRDLTSSKETYPPSRYYYTEPVKDGKGHSGFQLCLQSAVCVHGVCHLHLRAAAKLSSLPRRGGRNLQRSMISSTGVLSTQYNKTVNSQFGRLGIITAWQTKNTKTASTNGVRKWITTCAGKMAGWHWQVCSGCARAPTSSAPILKATSFCPNVRPRGWARLNSMANNVTLNVEADLPVEVNGVAAKSALLDTDQEDVPSFITFSDIRMVVVRRSKGVGIRLWDNAREERRTLPQPTVVSRQRRVARPCHVYPL